MSETVRKVPRQSPDLHPHVRGGYFRFPYFNENFPRSPIPYRYGQDILQGPQAWVPPAYQRFPYFNDNFPRNPIPWRYGQDVLQPERAFLPLGFQRFPFFQEPPAAPANPVIQFMHARFPLADPPAWVPPAFLPFPYWQAPPAGANPVISFIMGQALLRDQDPWIMAGFARVVPFAPISQVPSFLYGRALLEPETLFPRAEYQRFPFVSTTPPPPANPVISMRMGQPVLVGAEVEAAALTHYQQFPYWQEPPVVPGGEEYIITFRRRRGR